MGKIESIRQFLAKREGKTENPKGSNNIDCNTWFYGKEVSGDAFPWCVVEIVHAFFKTGNGSLIKKTASSSDLYRYYSSKNQIVKSPKAGDIVFFKFSKTKGVIAEHVGWVDKVNSDGSIWTYEGNTSVSGSQSNGGMCCHKKRSNNIVGYARPKYGEIEYPLLKKGSKGEDVKLLHKKLRMFGYGVSQYDDTYSDLTKSCITHFQALEGLEIDGICGNKTWERINARS